jgi:hypothetical protein
MFTPYDGLATKIAHDLFPDLVGYSRFSIKEQVPPSTQK